MKCDGGIGKSLGCYYDLQGARRLCAMHCFALFVFFCVEMCFCMNQVKMLNLNFQSRECF